MADLKEELAKIEQLAKEDERFHGEFIVVVETRITERVAAFLTSKGFAVAAEELRSQVNDGIDVDEAELQAVVGGSSRSEKVEAYCGDLSSFFCGFALASALWNPSY